jgi:S1-C subfamily serine protease
MGKRIRLGIAIVTGLLGVAAGALVIAIRYHEVRRAAADADRATSEAERAKSGIQKEPVKLDEQWKQGITLSAWPGFVEGKVYPYVTEVETDSSAARVGLLPGDILLSYNGVSLESETVTNNVLWGATEAARKANQSWVDLVIVRNRTILRMSVPGGVRLGITMQVPEIGGRASNTGEAKR